MTDAVLDEILEELDDEPRCAGCGREMVFREQWAKADEAERAELIEEGYVRHRREGKCYACIKPLSRTRTRLDPAVYNARKKFRGQTVRQYLEARDQGMTTIVEIAEHIGIGPAGLRKAIKRARDNGQEIP